MTSGYYWAVEKTGHEYVCRYDEKTDKFQFVGSRYHFTLEELTAMQVQFYRINRPKQNDDSM